jgi:hypothetical protein
MFCVRSGAAALIRSARKIMHIQQVSLVLSFISVLALTSCSTNKAAFDTSTSSERLGGWDKVKWGDSREYVQKKYPEATLKRTSTGTDPLILRRVDVGQPSDYEALFHFTNDRLWCVILTDKSATGFKHLQEYKSLRTKFFRRYGVPVIDNREQWYSKDKVTALRVSSWKGLNIEVLLSHYGIKNLNDESTIEIIYSSPTPKAQL